LENLPADILSIGMQAEGAWVLDSESLHQYRGFLDIAVTHLFSHKEMNRDGILLQLIYALKVKLSPLF